MSIEFKCLMCNARLSLPDEVAGRKEKCTNCGATVAVPAPLGGRLTAKRLPASGTDKTAADPMQGSDSPTALPAASVTSSAPRRGRIMGSNRVAAAVAGLNRVLADWTQAGRRPHPPRTYWWIFALVGCLLPTLFFAIAIMVEAFQNGIRQPGMLLVVMLVIGFLCGMGSGAFGWMIDSSARASYRSLESAAQSLGFSYLGERRIPVRDAPWYAVLPLLHFEEDAGDAALATTVVVAGRMDDTDVFVVRLRQFVNLAVRPNDSPIANAVQSMNRRNTLQCRWLIAIVVCGGPADTPDLLVLPRDDLERHYNERELPALQHVHMHPLTAHWVASSHHEWAQQACRNLPPRIQHDKQLALQLLSGNLVLWRGTWRLVGPDAKSAGDWIADIRLAIELRRLLTTRETAKTQSPTARTS